MTLHSSQPPLNAVDTSSSDCLERWEDEGGQPCARQQADAAAKPRFVNRYRLRKLRAQHALLDRRLASLSSSTSVPSNELRDLKKRKLFLKDKITRLLRA